MSELPTERKKSMVYTRTGDKGTSSLYSGERRLKDDNVFHTLGAVDELNANVGLAREYCVEAQNGIEAQLEEIQSRLFDVGSAVATPLSSSKESKLVRVKFAEQNVESLEEWIDAIDAQLPPLKNFILPSGGLSASQLHICRTVCRRAERLVVGLVREEETEEVVGKYLNRLSDYFFVVARFAAMKEGKDERIWTKPRF